MRIKVHEVAAVPALAQESAACPEEFGKASRQVPGPGGEALSTSSVRCGMAAAAFELRRSWTAIYQRRAPDRCQLTLDLPASCRR